MLRLRFKAAVLLSVLVPAAAVAGPSPWWEHYDRIDRYRCGEEEKVLVERNDSQASLYMRGYRMNLFRDQQTHCLSAIPIANSASRSAAMRWRLKT